MSDRAYAWMVEKLEMTEFESRDRLALLAFLDLVMSNPLRASQDIPTWPTLVPGGNLWHQLSCRLVPAWPTWYQGVA